MDTMPRPVKRIAQILLVVLVVLAVFAVMKIIHASFGASENFESYTNGASLNGVNNGTGWTGAWSVTGSNMTSATTATLQGTISAKHTGTAGNAVRSFTASGVGTTTLMMQISGTAPNDEASVRIRDGVGDGKIIVKFGATAIQAFNGASYQDVESGKTYSANTTYTATIEWNDTAENDKWRVKITGGTYTGTYTPWIGTNGTYTTLQQINIRGDATNVDIFWDDINDPTTGGGGGGTTTATSTPNTLCSGLASTTACSLVDNPIADLFYGVIIFFISAFFVTHAVGRRYG